MADFLEILAEANIRDWQRRVVAGEATAQGGQGPAIDSLESQLFNEIVALHARAKAETDPAAKATQLTQARNLRIQLLVAVERERPRLAQALDAQLALAIGQLP